MRERVTRIGLLEQGKSEGHRGGGITEEGENNGGEEGGGNGGC